MAKKPTVKKNKDGTVKKKAGRKPGQVYAPKQEKQPDAPAMDISVSELTEQQKHDAAREEWLRKGN